MKSTNSCGEDDYSKTVLTGNGDPDPLKRVLLKPWLMLNKSNKQVEEAI